MHATGWLMAAARDDPRDRLAAEEEEEEEEGEEEGEEETIGTRSETIDARLDVRVDEPGGSRSRSRVRPRVEIRLMPNDPALGRAYFVSYLRAIAYHRRRWNNHRREKKKPASSERTSDASLSDADAWWLARTRRKGPLVLAASPEAYGRHWAHVLATRASRATARVTSGYLFLLLALDLAGQDEPPPAEAPPEARDDDGAETSSSSAGAGSLGASATRSPTSPPARIALYGFEDDPRNAADAAGGHYFDGLHKQRHDLYDLAWERAQLAALVARRPDAVTRAMYLSPDERLRIGR
jgi:hypothetical protein